MSDGGMFLHSLGPASLVAAVVAAPVSLAAGGTSAGTSGTATAVSEATGFFSTSFNVVNVANALSGINLARGGLTSLASYSGQLSRIGWTAGSVGVANGISFLERGEGLSSADSGGVASSAYGISTGLGILGKTTVPSATGANASVQGMNIAGKTYEAAGVAAEEASSLGAQMYTAAGNAVSRLGAESFGRGIASLGAEGVLPSIGRAAVSSAGTTLGYAGVTKLTTGTADWNNALKFGAVMGTMSLGGSLARADGAMLSGVGRSVWTGSAVTGGYAGISQFATGNAHWSDALKFGGTAALAVASAGLVAREAAVAPTTSTLAENATAQIARQSDKLVSLSTLGRAGFSGAASMGSYAGFSNVVNGKPDWDTAWKVGVTGAVASVGGSLARSASPAAAEGASSFSLKGFGASAVSEGALWGHTYVMSDAFMSAYDHRPGEFNFMNSYATGFGKGVAFGGSMNALGSIAGSEMGAIGKGLSSAAVGGVGLTAYNGIERMGAKEQWDLKTFGGNGEWKWDFAKGALMAGMSSLAMNPRMISAASAESSLTVAGKYALGATAGAGINVGVNYARAWSNNKEYTGKEAWADAGIGAGMGLMGTYWARGLNRFTVDSQGNLVKVTEGLANNNQLAFKRMADPGELYNQAAIGAMKWTYVSPAFTTGKALWNAAFTGQFNLSGDDLMRAAISGPKDGLWMAPTFGFTQVGGGVAETAEQKVMSKIQNGPFEAPVMNQLYRDVVYMPGFVTGVETGLEAANKHLSMWTLGQTEAQYDKFAHEKADLLKSGMSESQAENKMFETYGRTEMMGSTVKGFGSFGAMLAAPAYHPANPNVYINNAVDKARDLSSNTRVEASSGTGNLDALRSESIIATHGVEIPAPRIPDMMEGARPQAPPVLEPLAATQEIAGFNHTASTEIPSLSLDTLSAARPNESFSHSETAFGEMAHPQMTTSTMAGRTESGLEGALTSSREIAGAETFGKPLSEISTHEMGSVNDLHAPEGQMPSTTGVEIAGLSSRELTASTLAHPETSIGKEFLGSRAEMAGLENFGAREIGRSEIAASALGAEHLAQGVADMGVEARQAASERERLSAVQASKVAAERQGILGEIDKAGQVVGTGKAEGQIVRAEGLQAVAREFEARGDNVNADWARAQRDAALDKAAELAKSDAEQGMVASGKIAYQLKEALFAEAVKNPTSEARVKLDALIKAIEGLGNSALRKAEVSKELGDFARTAKDADVKAAVDKIALQKNLEARQEAKSNGDAATLQIARDINRVYKGEQRLESVVPAVEPVSGTVPSAKSNIDARLAKAVQDLTTAETRLKGAKSDAEITSGTKVRDSLSKLVDRLRKLSADQSQQKIQDAQVSRRERAFGNMERAALLLGDSASAQRKLASGWDRVSKILQSSGDREGALKASGEKLKLQAALPEYRSSAVAKALNELNVQWESYKNDSGHDASDLATLDAATRKVELAMQDVTAQRMVAGASNSVQKNLALAEQFGVKAEQARNDAEILRQKIERTAAEEPSRSTMEGTRRELLTAAKEAGDLSAEHSGRMQAELELGKRAEAISALEKQLLKTSAGPERQAVEQDISRLKADHEFLSGLLKSSVAADLPEARAKIAGEIAATEHALNALNAEASPREARALETRKADLEKQLNALADKTNLGRTLLSRNDFQVLSDAMDMAFDIDVKVRELSQRPEFQNRDSAVAKEVRDLQEQSQWLRERIAEASSQREKAGVDLPLIKARLETLEASKRTTEAKDAAQKAATPSEPSIADQLKRQRDQLLSQNPMLALDQMTRGRALPFSTERAKAQMEFMKADRALRSTDMESGDVQKVWGERDKALLRVDLRETQADLAASAKSSEPSADRKSLLARLDKAVAALENYNPQRVQALSDEIAKRESNGESPEDAKAALQQKRAELKAQQEIFSEASLALAHARSFRQIEKLMDTDAGLQGTARYLARANQLSLMIVENDRRMSEQDGVIKDLQTQKAEQEKALETQDTPDRRQKIQELAQSIESAEAKKVSIREDWAKYSADITRDADLLHALAVIKFSSETLPIDKAAAKDILDKVEAQKGMEMSPELHQKAMDFAKDLLAKSGAVSTDALKDTGLSRENLKEFFKKSGATEDIINRIQSIETLVRDIKQMADNRTFRQEHMAERLGIIMAASLGYYMNKEIEILRSHAKDGSSFGQILETLRQEIVAQAKSQRATEDALALIEILKDPSITAEALTKTVREDLGRTEDITGPVIISPERAEAFRDIARKYFPEAFEKGQEGLVGLSRKSADLKGSAEERGASIGDLAQEAMSRLSHRGAGDRGQSPKGDARKTSGDFEDSVSRFEKARYEMLAKYEDLGKYLGSPEKVKQVVDYIRESEDHWQAFGYKLDMGDYFTDVVDRTTGQMKSQHRFALIEAFVDAALDPGGRIFIKDTGGGKTMMELMGDELSRVLGYRARGDRTVIVTPTDQNVPEFMKDVPKVPPLGTKYLAMLGEKAYEFNATRYKQERDSYLQKEADNTLTKVDKDNAYKLGWEEVIKDSVNFKDYDVVVMSGNVAYRMHIESGSAGSEFIKSMKDGKNSLKLDDIQEMYKGAGLVLSKHYTADMFGNERLKSEIETAAELTGKIYKQVEDLVSKNRDALTEHGAAPQSIVEAVHNSVFGDARIPDVEQNKKFIDSVIDASWRQLGRINTESFYTTIKTTINGEEYTGTIEGRKSDLKLVIKWEGADKAQVDRLTREYGTPEDIRKDNLSPDFVLAEQGNTKKDHIFHSAVDAAVCAIAVGAKDQTVADYLSRPENASSSDIFKIIRDVGPAHIQMYTATILPETSRALGFDIDMARGTNERGELTTHGDVVVIGKSEPLQRDQVKFSYGEYRSMFDGVIRDVVSSVNNKDSKVTVEVIVTDSGDAAVEAQNRMNEAGIRNVRITGTSEKAAESEAARNAILDVVKSNREKGTNEKIVIILPRFDAGMNLLSFDGLSEGMTYKANIRQVGQLMDAVSYKQLVGRGTSNIGNTEAKRAYLAETVKDANGNEIGQIRAYVDIGRLNDTDRARFDGVSDADKEAELFNIAERKTQDIDQQSSERARRTLLGVRMEGATGEAITAEHQAFELQQAATELSRTYGGLAHVDVSRVSEKASLDQREPAKLSEDVLKDKSIGDMLTHLREGDQAVALANRVISSGASLEGKRTYFSQYFEVNTTNNNPTNSSLTSNGTPFNGTISQTTGRLTAIGSAFANQLNMLPAGTVLNDQVFESLHAAAVQSVGEKINAGYKVAHFRSNDGDVMWVKYDPAQRFVDVLADNAFTYEQGHGENTVIDLPIVQRWNFSAVDTSAYAGPAHISYNPSQAAAVVNGMSVPNGALVSENNDYIYNLKRSTGADGKETLQRNIQFILQNNRIYAKDPGGNYTIRFDANGRTMLKGLGIQEIKGKLFVTEKKNPAALIEVGALEAPKSLASGRVQILATISGLALDSAVKDLNDAMRDIQQHMALRQKAIEDGNGALKATAEEGINNTIKSLVERRGGFKTSVDTEGRLKIELNEEMKSGFMSDRLARIMRTIDKTSNIKEIIVDFDIEDDGQAATTDNQSIKLGIGTLVSALTRNDRVGMNVLRHEVMHLVDRMNKAQGRTFTTSWGKKTMMRAARFNRKDYGIVRFDAFQKLEADGKIPAAERVFKDLIDKGYIRIAEFEQDGEMVKIPVLGENFAKLGGRTFKAEDLVGYDETQRKAIFEVMNGGEAIGIYDRNTALGEVYTQLYEGRGNMVAMAQAQKRNDMREVRSRAKMAADNFGRAREIAYRFLGITESAARNIDLSNVQVVKDDDGKYIAKLNMPHLNYELSIPVGEKTKADQGMLEELKGMLGNTVHALQMSAVDADILLKTTKIHAENPIMWKVQQAAYVQKLAPLMDDSLGVEKTELGAKRLVAEIMGDSLYKMSSDGGNIVTITSTTTGRGMVVNKNTGTIVSFFSTGKTSKGLQDGMAKDMPKAFENAGITRAQENILRPQAVVEAIERVKQAMPDELGSEISVKSDSSNNMVVTGSRMALGMLLMHPDIERAAESGVVHFVPTDIEEHAVTSSVGLMPQPQAPPVAVQESKPDHAQLSLGDRIANIFSGMILKGGQVSGVPSAKAPATPSNVTNISRPEPASLKEFLAGLKAAALKKEKETAQKAKDHAQSFYARAEARQASWMKPAPLPNGMTLKTISVEDADLVKQVGDLSLDVLPDFEEELPAKALIRFNQKPGQNLFSDLAVTDANGLVAGFIITSLEDTSAHVERLGVRKDVLRNGIATQLLKTVAQRAKEIGLETMTLGVEADNTPAITLYKKLGFSEKPGREGAFLARVADVLANADRAQVVEERNTPKALHEVRTRLLKNDLSANGVVNLGGVVLDRQQYTPLNHVAWLAKSFKDAWQGRQYRYLLLYSFTALMLGKVPSADPFFDKDGNLSEIRIRQGGTTFARLLAATGVVTGVVGAALGIPHAVSLGFYMAVPYGADKLTSVPFPSSKYAAHEYLHAYQYLLIQKAADDGRITSAEEFYKANQMALEYVGRYNGKAVTPEIVADVERHLNGVIEAQSKTAAPTRDHAQIEAINIPQSISPETLQGMIEKIDSTIKFPPTVKSFILLERKILKTWASQQAVRQLTIALNEHPEFSKAMAETKELSPAPKVTIKESLAETIARIKSELPNLGDIHGKPKADRIYSEMARYRQGVLKVIEGTEFQTPEAFDNFLDDAIAALDEGRNISDKDETTLIRRMVKLSMQKGETMFDLVNAGRRQFDKLERDTHLGSSVHTGAQNAAKDMLALAVQFWQAEGDGSYKWQEFYLKKIPSGKIRKIELTFALSLALISLKAPFANNMPEGVASALKMIKENAEKISIEELADVISMVDWNDNKQAGITQAIMSDTVGQAKFDAAKAKAKVTGAADFKPFELTAKTANTGVLRTIYNRYEQLKAENRFDKAKFSEWLAKWAPDYKFEFTQDGKLMFLGRDKKPAPDVLSGEDAQIMGLRAKIKRQYKKYQDGKINETQLKNSVQLYLDQIADIEAENDVQAGAQVRQNIASQVARIPAGQPVQARAVSGEKVQKPMVLSSPDESGKNIIEDTGEAMTQEPVRPAMPAIEGTTIAPTQMPLPQAMMGTLVKAINAGVAKAAQAVGIKNDLKVAASQRPAKKIAKKSNEAERLVAINKKKPEAIKPRPGPVQNAFTALAGRSRELWTNANHFLAEISKALDAKTIDRAQINGANDNEHFRRVLAAKLQATHSEPQTVLADTFEKEIAPAINAPKPGQEGRVFIAKGETGTGKSSVVPVAIFDAVKGNRKVVVLENNQGQVLQNFKEVEAYASALGQKIGRAITVAVVSLAEGLEAVKAKVEGADILIVEDIEMKSLIGQSYKKPEAASALGALLKNAVFYEGEFLARPALNISEQGDQKVGAQDIRGIVSALREFGENYADVTTRKDVKIAADLIESVPVAYSERAVKLVLDQYEGKKDALSTIEMIRGGKNGAETIAFMQAAVQAIADLKEGRIALPLGERATQLVDRMGSVSTGVRPQDTLTTAANREVLLASTRKGGREAQGLTDDELLSQSEGARVTDMDVIRTAREHGADVVLLSGSVDVKTAEEATHVLGARVLGQGILEQDEKKFANVFGARDGHTLTQATFKPGANMEETLDGIMKEAGARGGNAIIEDARREAGADINPFDDLTRKSLAAAATSN
ncbi:MAG: GNAT family N-acetyltransferase, partial [Candidatus Omnitrophica bacterium]|nr:GNAT family N-acetyltransferase [Candidatus Omnitrophota bacterium]